jgi:hypothetical protein
MKKINGGVLLGSISAPCNFASIKEILLGSLKNIFLNLKVSFCPFLIESSFGC